MEDQNKSQPQATQTDANPVANPPANFPRVQDISTGEAQQGANEERQIVREMSSEFRKAERWTIGINILGLVAIIATLSIYSGQLNQMTTQSELLAVQLASASRDSVENTKRLDKQLSAIREQATAAQGQVDAAQRSADILKKQMLLDQRPWLGIVNTETTGLTHTKDQAQVERVRIFVRNSGKTPALSVGFDCCYVENIPWRDPEPTYESVIAQKRLRSLESDKERWAEEEEMIRKEPQRAASIREMEKQIAATGHEMDKEMKKISQSEQAIAPNVTFEKDLIARQIWQRRASDGKTPLVTYLIGRILYYDVMDKKSLHSTTICLKADPEISTQFAFCQKGNAMK